MLDFDTNLSMHGFFVLYCNDNFSYQLLVCYVRFFWYVRYMDVHLERIDALFCFGMWTFILDKLELSRKFVLIN